MSITWNSGTPALGGWYNASIDQHPEARRYWDGACWSAPCYPGDPAPIVAAARGNPTSASEPISWRSLQDRHRFDSPVSSWPFRVEVDAKPTNPKDVVGVRKAPMSTVPGPVIAELGVAMLEGAAKYGRHNYRAVGVRASVYYDATMRHLIAWWEGEDTDADSGLSHVTKAIASLAVLRDAMVQGQVEDDRPPPSEPFYADLNARAGATLDKHADKSPHHYTAGDDL